MTWKKAVQQRQLISLATSSKSGTPRAIIVTSLGFIEGKLLIGECVMKQTFSNIKTNNKVSIVAQYDKEYYRIDGRTKFYSKGKYFDAALKRSNPPLPRKAIVVDIKEVFDLDKLKKII